MFNGLDACEQRVKLHVSIDQSVRSIKGGLALAHLEVIGGHPALHEKHGLLRRVGLFRRPGFELGESVDEILKLLS